MGLYLSALRDGDRTRAMKHENALRKLVTVLKRWALAAPTCKHEERRTMTVVCYGKSYKFWHCKECGHSEDPERAIAAEKERDALRD